MAAVENYQMRPDGTPRYTMVAKFGPFPMRVISDYSVYEPPRRTVNRVLDSPLGGTAYFTFEPVAGGTRVTQRWEVEPQNPLVGLLLPVMRPLLAWSMQRDLDTLARAATPQGDQQRQEERMNSGRGLGGVVVASLIAVLAFLLFRRRSFTEEYSGGAAKLGRRRSVLGTAKTIYVGGTLLSILVSLSLFLSGRRESGIFVGLWAPTILNLGQSLLEDKKSAQRSTWLKATSRLLS